MSEDAFYSFLRKRIPLLGALLILFVLYAAAVAYIYSIQRNLLYFPSHNYITPREAGADPTLYELPVTTADGIERLWEVSTNLLEAPLPVRFYEPGSWGPNAIHQLIAPSAWRLPFERGWRDPNNVGS